MSLSSYLAQKYLNAEPSSSSTSKKRKRRQGTTSGLIIADDDALGWSSAPKTEEDDDGIPTTVTSGSAEFRKSKKSAWKTVGVPALQPTKNEDQEMREADAIIASAAAEKKAGQEDDDDPIIEGDDEGVVKMGDGTHAGLQTASAVAAQMAKRKREEAEAWEREEAASGRKGRKGGEETVYRDATGRRIDLSMRRAEARREADEKARKEREEQDAQKGDVQLQAREKRKEELDDARFMTVARGIDDEELNRDLKEQDRWNDPAAQFLVKKKTGKSASGKPLYTGPSAPNRYGIRPGHKWDGVDRGNGWEGERFKGLNRRARNKDLGFQWEMDE